MSRTFVLSILMILLAAIPSLALDFTADDFDPPDESMRDAYTVAVNDLMDEMRIVATDDAENQLFIVTPFPMELVAVMAQSEIHQLDSDDPDAIDEIIERANHNKPSANSFAILLDGNTDWVTGNVEMFYTIPDELEYAQVPTVPLGQGEGEDGSTLAEWLVYFEDIDSLMTFLESPDVVLRVFKADDSGDNMRLDCGFWRQWGLFDLRSEEEVEEEPEEAPSS
jgi:hypothetical protein